MSLPAALRRFQHLLVPFRRQVVGTCLWLPGLPRAEEVERRSPVSPTTRITSIRRQGAPGLRTLRLIRWRIFGMRRTVWRDLLLLRLHQALLEQPVLR